MSLENLKDQVLQADKFSTWRKTATVETWAAMSGYLCFCPNEDSNSQPNAVGSRLTPCGFIRDHVAAMFEFEPERLKPEYMVFACRGAWLSRMADYPNVSSCGHVYSASLAPALVQLLEGAEMDPEKLLIGGVLVVFRNFQKTYYPHDRFGFVVHVRKGAGTVSADVLLFPRTERGAVLRISEEPHAKQRHHCFRKWFDQFVRESFSNTFVKPAQASDRPADAVLQRWLITREAFDISKGLGKSGPEWMKSFAATCSDLLALDENKLAGLLKQTLQIHAARVRTDSSSKDFFDASFKDVAQGREATKQGLKNSACTLKDARKRQRQVMDRALRGSLDMCAHLRLVRVFNRSYGSCVFDATNEYEKSWIQARIDETAGTSATETPGRYKELDQMLKQGDLTQFLSVPKSQRQSFKGVRGFLRAAFLLRLDKCLSDLEQIQTEIDNALRARKGCLLALDYLRLRTCELEAMAKRKLPPIVERIEELERLRMHITILCRPIMSEEFVGDYEIQQIENSLEDSDRHIASSLARIRSETEKPSVEFHRYLRSLTDGQPFAPIADPTLQSGSKHGADCLATGSEKIPADRESWMTPTYHHSDTEFEF